MHHRYGVLTAVLLLTVSVSVLNAQSSFWKQMNIGLNANVRAVVVTPQGIMMAGTDNGVYVSSDTGTTWIQRNDGMPAVRPVTSLVSDSKGTVYAALYSYGLPGKVVKLPVGSTEWQDKSAGLNSNSLIPLGADQKNDIIFAGTQSGAYSLGASDTAWRKIDAVELTNAHVCCFTVDTVNGFIYTGTWNGILRSADKGVTWTHLGTSTSFIVETMAINSKSYIFAGSTNFGVYRSTDNGQTWVEKNPMMMDSLATNIVVNAKDIVFANTQGGIFKSTNNGDSWTPLTGNLMRTTYLGLDARQYLYAGSSTGSVYRTSISTTTGIAGGLISPSAAVRLENAYPNPFNPSTMISFSLPTRSFVTLKVFDVMGREVSTIASEEMPAGNYSRQWIASGFPSGMYFYRLQAGAYTETKRMMILK
jgi:photosystem II stability/assembly factor-like uncharacterized protein